MPLGADFGTDVYYHIRVSDIFPFVATTQKFPWTEMSIWKHSFYDKELGFHAVIYVLRLLSSFLGISLNAPFHFINFILVFFVLLTMSIGGYIYCKSASFLIPPLYLFIAPISIQRLICIRPFIFSVIIFITIVFILLSRLKLKTKCIFMFFIGWLYVLFYSVPHLIIIPVTIYCVVRILYERSYKSLLTLFLLLCSTFGIAVGLCIHPQFPSTFTGWYVMAFLIIKQALGLGANDIMIGLGIRPPDLLTIVYNIPFLLISIFYMFFFFITKKKTIEQWFLLILQLVLISGYFCNQRFSEYAIPIIIFNFSYAVFNYKNFILNSKICRFIDTWKYALIIIFLLIAIPFNKFILKHSVFYPPLYDYGRWASENLKPGTYVALLRWHNFGRAFYVASQYSYSTALDPMYSYFIYPERTKKIERFITGKILLTPEELAELFGTNLLYISMRGDLPFAEYLIYCGAVILYSDKQGCLLELTKSNSFIQPRPKPPKLQFLGDV